MACYTQEEIAEREAVTQQAIGLVLQETADLPKLVKSDIAAAEHNDGTDDNGDPRWMPPIYNIWKQQTKSEGSSHFGNSEARWVDNLLYLYTKPFDIVVDPFSGGGSRAF